MRRSVGDAFAGGGNNFDALRLVAALLVLFSHCYPLTGLGKDPIVRWTGGHTDGGGAAVAAFFVISGFLVTRSVLARSPGDYVQARLLRILPALATVTVLQTVVLGALFTTLPLGAYFTDRQTWEGLRDMTVFDLRFGLPGVFAANPYHDVVNGSLWTLPVECSFYIALPFLALCGLLRPGRIGLLLLAALVGLFPVASWYGLSWAAQGPAILRSVLLYPALSNAVYFLAGSALWVHRAAVPLSGGLAVGCLLGLFASAGTPTANFVFHLAWPYLVLYAALARPCTQSALRRVGDLSYGAYLYAFPLQQALIAAFPGIGPTRLFLLALPLVLLCAAASCHAVERPALRLKWRRQPAHAAA